MRMSWTSIPISFMIAMVASLSGCSAGAPNSAEGVSNKTGAAWIEGNWRGLLHNEAGENSGFSFTETAVVAEFRNTGEREGDFSLSLTEMEGTAVEGTYQGVGESIILNIKNSSMSLVGNPGDLTTVRYALLGNGLEFVNHKFRLVLVRHQNDDPEGGDEKSDEPATGLIGRWTCEDSTGLLWNIHIKSKSRFSSDVTQDGRRRLWHDGRVTLEDDGRTALLTVTHSNVSDYQGMTMAVKLLSQDELSIARSRVGSEGSDRFGCTRDID